MWKHIFKDKLGCQTTKLSKPEIYKTYLPSGASKMQNFFICPSAIIYQFYLPRATGQVPMSRPVPSCGDVQVSIKSNHILQILNDTIWYSTFAIHFFPIRYRYLKLFWVPAPIPIRQVTRLIHACFLIVNSFLLLTFTLLLPWLSLCQINQDIHLQMCDKQFSVALCQYCLRDSQALAFLNPFLLRDLRVKCRLEILYLWK